MSKTASKKRFRVSIRRTEVFEIEAKSAEEAKRLAVANSFTEPSLMQDPAILRRDTDTTWHAVQEITEKAGRVLLLRQHRAIKRVRRPGDQRKDRALQLKEYTFGE